MGLDGVELVMAVEENFGIEITDEEAGKITTVGDFYDLLLTKLQGQKVNRCLTSAAFYRIRRSFMDALGVQRKAITPVSPLEAIVPRACRRQQWTRVRSAARIEIPDLERPTWVWLLLAAFALFFAMTLIPVVYLLSRRFGPNGFTLLLPLGILFFLMVLSERLSRPLAIAFPSRAITVGDLAKEVLARNHARLSAEAGGWNRDEVWETLCRLIVNQTGVEREKIKPEARIVKDLGVD